ncbi:MAG: efflux RND transporter periplasmic adaptor subunit, partial [Planctomycetota bacterium]|nr:efflux RND transporter periplasmic adaptor subunit [Planctomycetota bacterium]
KSSIFVPATAVFANSSKQTFVWVVGGEEQTAQRRKITTGRLTETNRYEVISGLNDRDRVVTAGVNFIHTGMKLRVVE